MRIAVPAAEDALLTETPGQLLSGSVLGPAVGRYEAFEKLKGNMGLRITTWNVNGIRNPFSYQPWRDKKTFASMFEVLEADIVVFQETKIQRKDLRDDMVLVPGWDCYFSLPRHKKGYSGVVVYTRQSVCAPIRAEEGITGVLCPPNSSTKFADLPEAEQVGGYPTPVQLANSPVDATTIDSEGRCVVLEFPAFVLLGVYSPADRDESRDDFRLGFLDLLDARVRNLIHMGKRVVLTGDLNISREEVDTANAEASMRKNGFADQEYTSTPARRLFNQLLEGGKVFGERDEGREQAVLWDTARGFHPTRKGMFTCWEQKKNARPGNFGSRIDYVLCSLDMKTWFCDSNIQEGLLGSDHCPVYATMKTNMVLDGIEVNLLDTMNPPGMFVGGQRRREYTMKDTLPLSGKLIPEFDRRRSIRDMFSNPSLPTRPSAGLSVAVQEDSLMPAQSDGSDDRRPARRETENPQMDESEPPSPVPPMQGPASFKSASPGSVSGGNKRPVSEIFTNRPLKRAKSGSSASAPDGTGKGQQSLNGFFKPKTTAAREVVGNGVAGVPPSTQYGNGSGASLQPAAAVVEQTMTGGTTHQSLPAAPSKPDSTPPVAGLGPLYGSRSGDTPPTAISQGSVQDQADVHDPVESKESWSKLFTKPAAPRCEGHDEPCVSLLTKKSGINRGRSFWMCARPLGPTGAKERNTQWRCQTFIWCSDWNGGVT